MKFLLTFVMMIMAVWSVLGQEVNPSGQNLNLKEVEKLLQQIEAEQTKVKPTDDPTVSESLKKLFSSFRQV